MKKILCLIFAILLTLILCVSLVACGYPMEDLIDPNTPRSSIQFNNYNELSSFIRETDRLPKAYYLLLDVRNKYTQLLKEYYKLTYTSVSDVEVDDVETTYSDPSIEIVGRVFDESFDVSFDGWFREYSFAFRFISYSSNNRLSSLKLKHFDEGKNSELFDSKLMYHRVIYIYSNRELVGKLFYYTDFELSTKWVEKFIKDNLVVVEI